MAITEIPGSDASAPNDITETAATSPSAPANITEAAEAGASLPATIAQKAASDASAPVNVAEVTEASPSAPNSLTEKTLVSASAPTNITESTAASASAPANIAEATEASASAPVNIAESTASSASAPANITEATASGASAPVNIAEVTRAVFPRTLTPLVSMDFAAQAYAQDQRPVTFDDLFTYARNSNASFWNRRKDRNGKWETFLDTDVVGSVENLLAYSEQFDHADWTKTSTSVTANAIIAPDGTKTADKLIEDTGAVSKFIFQNTDAITSGNEYTFIIAAKKGERKYIQVIFGTGDVSGDPYMTFDIDSGVMSGSSTIVSSITYNKDGWFDISAKVTSAVSTAFGCIVRIVDSLSSNRTSTYTGDGTSGIYIWGAQLTESAKPLPYVKSISAATTETFTETLRMEYDPITAEAKGALIEGGDTNLALNSEDFSAWSGGTSPTIVSNDYIAPDGTTSMDKITATATGSVVFQDITLGVSIDYNVSLYIKNIDSTRSRIRLYDNTGLDTQGELHITWTSGVPSTQSSTGAANINYENCGDGVYRISFQTTADAVNTNHRFYFYPDTVDGTKSVYAWGAQCEANDIASSYIRTEGSTVARVADDTTASASGNANPNIGTLVFEGSPYGVSASNQYAISINDDSTDNRIIIRTDGSANNLRTVFVSDAVTTVAYNSADDWNSNQKHIVTFEQDNVITYTDGSNIGSDTSCAMPLEFATIDIGQGYASNLQFYGHINKIIIYEELMTAQEVGLQ